MFRGVVHRGRGRGERGANLVEFALVMPFLLLLIFGIMEFGWLLATNLDVQQGAREGARLTAVDLPAGNEALRDEVCDRMGIIGNRPETLITWESDGTPEVGEGVRLTVVTPVETLTGLLNFVFSSFTDLEATVEIRIEQPPTWTDQTLACA